jgi:hypothetical protein
MPCVPARELTKKNSDYDSTMPTKTKSRGQDRKRVSAQKHEISYAGRKVGKNGAAAVRKAKAKLGRTTARSKVMKRAKALA